MKQKTELKHGAILIGNAAESFGAIYNGRQTGMWGTYRTISQNGNKIITGSAGGYLICGTEEEANRARKWSTQSREAAPWYDHEELGYNYRMSNIIAGIIRGQFEFIDEHIERKKEIYERYRDGLNAFNAEGRPIWKSMHIQPIFRNNVYITAIGSGRGISNAYIEGESAKDVSAGIFDRGLCLPSDIKMTEEEQDMVVEIIHACFK